MAVPSSAVHLRVMGFAGEARTNKSGAISIGMAIFYPSNVQMKKPTRLQILASYFACGYNVNRYRFKMGTGLREYDKKTFWDIVLAGDQYAGLD